MTTEKFVRSLFEETLAVMGDNAPGTLFERDGRLYYSGGYARYKLLGRNVQRGKQYDAIYAFTVER